MSERQVIDAQGRFIGGLSETAPDTAAYQVISVVGCQSGGKSTLLNTAFATSFPILDAPRVGRRRTTLGVWGAITNGEVSKSPLVVLDVEGTDSRERGEGSVSFESRTSLFALAVSDVVLINMWAHDVGRHSAANYDLFETVFARSTATPRTCRVRLVVVVRDCEDEALLPEISRVLMGDMRNIWLSLKFPAAQFDKQFDARVVALPHKLYSPEAFISQAQELGRSIADTAQVEKAVPLSGFDTFAREVWLSICQSTGGDGADSKFTLDLPRHVALTAHFKCGEIVQGIFDGEVGVGIEGIRAEIESEWRRPIPDFGVRIDALTRDAFEVYDDATKAYRGGQTTDAVTQRRHELGIELVTRLSELRERYLWICRDFCMNGFEDEFRPMLGGTNGYERNAKRLANSYVTQYRNLVEGARLPSVLDEFRESEDDGKGLGRESNEGVALQREGVVETMDPEDELENQLNPESALNDDDIDIDEYSVDTFKRDVFRLVEERRRLGELMLPGGTNFAAIGPKKDPWWKGLLIRGAILLINYLQATHGHRAALKLQRKQEREHPPSPSF